MPKHARIRVTPKRGPRVSEALARPARTALQGGAGYAVAQLVDEFHDITDGQVVAVAGVLTLFFGWLQTTIENYLGTALLREVPPVDAPVVDTPGEDPGEDPGEAIRARNQRQGIS